MQQAAAIAYKKAVEAHPTHSSILCKYGGFAKHVENDYEKVSCLNPRRGGCTVFTDGVRCVLNRFELQQRARAAIGPRCTLEALQ